MLLDFMAAGLDYSAAKAQYKAQKAWQKYSNTMTRLSDSINQNAITQNTLMTTDDLVMQAMQIKTDGMLATASSESMAAAAGVKGRSVRQTMGDILRNQAARESDRQTQFSHALIVESQQRLNSAMQSAMQQDHSYIPKPNAASYFLKAAIQSTDRMMMAGGA